jgi:acyl-CoA hydrolase
VNLFGKNVRQRAELLISLAHPSFREELLEHCVRARWFQRNERNATMMAAAASGERI